MQDRKNLMTSCLEILGQKFIRDMNKFFFKLKHGKTGEEMEKSAT